METIELSFEMTIVPSKRDPQKIPCVPKHLQPLYDAMKKGRRIKSVTCYCGKVNRNVPENNFTITDFVAISYTIAASALYTEQYDFFFTDKTGEGPRGTFFMPWVLNYELYEESLN